MKFVVEFEVRGNGLVYQHRPILITRAVNDGNCLDRGGVRVRGTLSNIIVGTWWIFSCERGRRQGRGSNRNRHNRKG